MSVHFIGIHAGKEIERIVVVADMVLAEVEILSLGPVALGSLEQAGLAAALPIAARSFNMRLLLAARPNTNTVEKLGIQFHCA
jgi:hypothetical protein